MTPGYRARRETKHLAEKRARREMAKIPPMLQTNDITSNLAKHALVGAKAYPQGNGGRKYRSGYAQEHTQALLDTATFIVALPKTIGGISEAAGVTEAVVGEYHDFIAMNANEIVLDPTPEDNERILRESEL